MQRFDLVIRNGTVIDGTRAPRFQADVGVREGRIAAVGDLSKSKTKEEIDASGKIVAPGFIDAHTHDDRLMLSSPDMAPKVSQGVTTVVAGNCGISLAPAPNGMRAPVPVPLDLLDGEGTWFSFKTFEQYIKALRAKPAATNCALLVGHAADASRVTFEAAGSQAANTRPFYRQSGLHSGRRFPPLIIVPEAGLGQSRANVAISGNGKTWLQVP